MTTNAAREPAAGEVRAPREDVGAAQAVPRVADTSAAASETSWLTARLPLLALVFMAGVVSLAIEMCGPRLIAPYFGTDLSIWANQIGFTLLYLTIGYTLGGRVADRWPRAGVLGAVTAAAALATALIPPLSTPILDWSVAGLESGGPSIAVRSLVPVIVLFSVPTILLGMVSPFSVRLAAERTGSAGRSAGAMYALSTVGSIVGAFLPVLVLIPAWGVRATLVACCVALLAVSALPLLARKAATARETRAVEGRR